MVRLSPNQCGLPSEQCPKCSPSNQYTGVPDDPTHLLKFIQSMAALSPFTNPPTPTLLHCSAGVGRTGTYITISSLLPLLSLIHTYQTTTSPPSASPIANLASLPTPHLLHPLGSYPSSPFPSPLTRDYIGLTIDSLREQRCCMVQNDTQVRWCFEALVKAWVMLSEGS